EVRPGHDRAAGAVANDRRRELTVHGRAHGEAIDRPGKTEGSVRQDALGVDVAVAAVVLPGHDRTTRAIRDHPRPPLVIRRGTQCASVGGPGGIHGAARQHALRVYVLVAVAVVHPRDDGAAGPIRDGPWPVDFEPGCVERATVHRPAGIHGAAREHVLRIDDRRTGAEVLPHDDGPAGAVPDDLRGLLSAVRHARGEPVRGPEWVDHAAGQDVL